MLGSHLNVFCSEEMEKFYFTIAFNFLFFFCWATENDSWPLRNDGAMDVVMVDEENVGLGEDFNE